MTEIHGPSGVEVSGIPVTQELVQSFGLRVSTIRGGLCTGGTDRAMVRKAFPNLYDHSVHDLTEKYRELIHTMSTDDGLIFHAEPAQQWQWKAGERESLSFLDERPHAVRELLNQTAVPP